jgi:hypothetical protein
MARAAAVLASLVVVAPCQAGAPRPSPAPVRVLSNYERATGNTIPRDCGYSSPLPGRPGWSLGCTGPGAYPASWISGLTRDPSSANLLISYDDYCVTGNADSLTAEGFG